MPQSRIIIFSCDALVGEDIEYLLKKPRFAELYARCASTESMRTIYPTVTYPCHTSMITGCYPEHHGVVNNMEFRPGQLKNIPWNWFADAVKCPDIFTAAKAKGLTTASVFWPVTACHPHIDYNIPEYWPQGEGDTQFDCFARAGTSRELWDRVVEPNIGGVTIRKHPETDQFIIDCCRDIIKLYKPHILALHTGDVDAYRHASGLFNEQVTRGVEDTERWLFDLIEATKEAGVFEETNFFLISDHGQLDVVRSIKPNVILADHGLIDANADGSLADWRAYCHSTGLSAQIKLRDPNDRDTWQKVYELLRHMCDEGIYGISRVYTREEARAEEHLDGDFAFVIETDGYTSFSEDWNRPLIKQNTNSDYRFGKATHGHHPDRGPQPVFLGFGPDIREGVRIGRRSTVDEAPTYAKILGLDYPHADGRAMDEILK
ncbi:MAG: alkaline phosphatase family protein [Clostridia bacterium]|nr:alkaline phosphatase family protein [Clostridia bacterium]